MSRLFLRGAGYFLSVGFDSLGELGMGAIGEVLVELELELVPVPLVVLLLVPVSAFGASAGAGVGAGAATGGVGAGAGGGVTTFSSFLQAMRPTARMAARRSERFIFFPLGSHTVDPNIERSVYGQGCDGLSDRHTYFSSSGVVCVMRCSSGHNPVTPPVAAGREISHNSTKRSSNCCAPSSSFMPRA
jgi:hypothetical protein